MRFTVEAEILISSKNSPFTLPLFLPRPPAPRDEGYSGLVALTIEYTDTTRSFMPSTIALLCDKSHDHVGTVAIYEGKDTAPGLGATITCETQLRE